MAAAVAEEAPPDRDAAAAGQSGSGGPPVDSGEEGSLAGLVKAVSSGAGVGPEEDVAAYLQGCVLPTLGPAIEELLHHVHESGELQRALREMAEVERARTMPARKSTSKALDAAAGEASSKSPKNADGATSDSPDYAVSPPGSSSGTRKRAGKSGEDRGGTSEGARSLSKSSNRRDEEENAVDAFDPLAWLSERLRQSAAGPTERFREQIEQRVIQHISEHEKTILEGNEEESAVPATPSGSRGGKLGEPANGTGSASAVPRQEKAPP